MTTYTPVTFDISDEHDTSKDLQFSYSLPSGIIPRIGETIFLKEKDDDDPLVEGTVTMVYWFLGPNNVVELYVGVIGDVDDDTEYIRQIFNNHGGEKKQTKQLTADDVRRWARRFIDQALNLKLSHRSYKAIFGYGGVTGLLHAGEYKFSEFKVEENLPDLFYRDGRFLEFDEWCELVLSGEISQDEFLSVYRVGKGAYKGLINCLRERETRPERS